MVFVISGSWFVLVYGLLPFAQEAWTFLVSIKIKNSLVFSILGLAVSLIFFVIALILDEINVASQKKEVIKEEESEE
jgi:hypothetical protein